MTAYTTYSPSDFLTDVKYLRSIRAIVKDKEIADNTGFSAPVVSNYLAGRVKPSRNFIDKFYAYYSDYLKRNVSKTATATGAEEPRVIYQNASRVVAGDIFIMEVPLVNQYAYAGYLRGYSDAEYLGSLPKIPWLVEKEYKGNYCSFEVRGDSMRDGTGDEYREGDKVLCREIIKDHWRDKLHIRKWDFIIVHKTEGILLKKIIDHDTGKGILKLHSLNDQYEDFEINLKDVAQIFNVVQVARKK